MKKILQEVIGKAYSRWQQGIVAGDIPTTNERTLQVYLAYYLLQQGKPLEENGKYKFRVLLEENMGEIHTCKTDGIGRCDIVVVLSSTGKPVRAAIEMKRPETKANAKNAATTDARFAVLADIENLEQYDTDLKYEIAYTDYHIYPHSREDVKYNISSGKKTEKSYPYKKNDKVDVLKLKGSYTFGWDDLPHDNLEHYFLKLKVK